jgi:hypothetical protein
LNPYKNNKGGEGRGKKETRRREKTQGRNGRNFHGTPLNLSVLFGCKN